MSRAPQRVVVMGLGLFGGGAAVARYFVERGAQVLVTDMRDEETLRAGIEAVGDARESIEWVLGEHRRSDFLHADLIVANPAVPPSHELLSAARQAGVRVTSEAELFLENCSARLAVLTGTQGKSSTANMAAQLLNASGFRAHLCGNVGRSLLESATQFDRSEICVLEISSYQLEAMQDRFVEGENRFENVEVIALTNVLADHLERHGTLENYARAKATLFDLPERAFAIVPEAGLPASAQVSRSGIERVVFAGPPKEPGNPAQRALWQSDGQFCFGLRSPSSAQETHEVLGRTNELTLPGEFQKTNALIALGIARLMGAPAASLREAIPSLRGLAHRMEILPEVCGRVVYDNGVSTTPDSTIAALESLPLRTVLLCGGKAKRLPLEELSKTCAQRQTRVVTFGAAAETLRSAMHGAGAESHVVQDLEEATWKALDWSAPGDTVLFSPACASFDAFPNFSARARAFREALHGWEQSRQQAPALEPSPGEATPHE